MMIDSHRHTSHRSQGPHARPTPKHASVTPEELYGSFDSRGRTWVDALDPTMPSEPRLAVCRPASFPPQHPHKLILSSASLSAGALVAGYLIASMLL